MKKVLSIVLSLVMVLCMMPVMAFAGTASGQYPDVSGEACENAVTTLSNLGVINGYEDGTYKPENVVTRAEAAKLVISALGLSDQAKGSSASFTDLANAKWAEGYIGYAESLGILEGDGDGKFRPADPVTYNEFAAIMVRALGYTDESLQGSYPAAHMAKANALGIMDDITGAGGANGANRGDCAIMLYNNLTNAIGTTDKDGKWTSNAASGEPADTMINRLGAVADDPKVITLSDARTAEFDLYPYIGAYATLYYDKNDKNQDEAIAISEVESTFLTGSFSKDVTANEATILTTGIEFESDGTTYTLKNDAVSDKPVGITNLEAASTTVKANDECVVAVETSGKYITKIYSVTAEKVTGEFQWTSTDAKNLTKSTPKIKTGVFELNDDKEIDTTSFELVGVDSLDDITEDAVVTYYTASGNSVVKVAVSTETVEGKVAKVSGKKYTIDGTVYEVSEELADKPSLGDEGTFYLNYKGEIAAYEAKSDTKYGVVLTNMGKDTGTNYGSDNYNKIKLLTADGSKTIFTLTEKESDEKDAAASGSGNRPAAFTVGRVVTYTLNSNNEISDITLVAIDEKGGQTLTPATGGKYLEAGYINGVEIADDVMVVVEEDSEYSIGSLSDLPKDETLTSATTYYVEDGKVEVIICGDTASDDVYGFVSDIATVKNADDETVQEITLVDGKSYLTTENDLVTVSGFDKSKLYKLVLSGDEVSSVTPVKTDKDTSVDSDKAVQDVNASKNTIKFGDSFKLVNTEAVIYKIVYKTDGTTFDKLEEIELSDIAEGDTATLYDTNVEDSDGYDYIVVKEA